jgi:hypothetical protein
MLDMDGPNMGGPMIDGPMGGTMFPFLFFPFMMVFMLVWVLLAIVLAMWVYKDAEMRGENGALWLVLVIITGWIGLLIWLVVRTSKPIFSSEIISNGEKTSFTSENMFCSSCGAELPPNSLFCSNCGASNDHNWDLQHIKGTTP